MFMIDLLFPVINQNLCSVNGFVLCFSLSLLLLSIISVDLLESKVHNKVQRPCLWFASGIETANKY